MKLATLPNGTRDGSLVLVNCSLTQAVESSPVAPSLQHALDHWLAVEPKLRELSERLEAGQCQDAFPFQPHKALAPLPRAYAFLDGSAYLNHVELVRKARGADLPPSLYTDPLMYQGCSDSFLAPHADIAHASEEQGIDFESEVCVIVDDVPQGTPEQNALQHIRLLVLMNDVTLRNLVPEELAKGFGFLVSKPPSSLSPVAVTPDELGDHWHGGRLHLPLVTTYNGRMYGDPDAGAEMHFSFPRLIAHAAQTRPLAAGTLLGGGTVSVKDRARGSSCLAERRMIEKIEQGRMVTPFMKFGDQVRIEMWMNGQSVFGAMVQTVTPLGRSSAA
jgi:fumarylacetoacetate (FAA) hydrolase